jgi:uncharacterized protein
MEEVNFEWDQWNIQKNEEKHGISVLEAQSAFYDEKIIVFDDMQHSSEEERYICYARSAYNNTLMIAFTIRNKKIRIISARRASKKERNVYESQT